MLESFSKITAFHRRIQTLKCGRVLVSLRVRKEDKKIQIRRRCSRSIYNSVYFFPEGVEFDWDLEIVNVTGVNSVVELWF